jgi:hypothetical protein
VDQDKGVDYSMVVVKVIIFQVMLTLVNFSRWVNVSYVLEKNSLGLGLQSEVGAIFCELKLFNRLFNKVVQRDVVAEVLDLKVGSLVFI